MTWRRRKREIGAATRRLLRERYQSDDGAPGFALSATSLDDQVRAYLQSFEEQAVFIEEGAVRTRRRRSAGSGSSPFMAMFERLLQEQEDDEAPADDVPEPAPDDDVEDLFADDGGDEPAPEEDRISVEEEEVVLAKPDTGMRLDVDSFAELVDGLVTTAAAKLDFNAIVSLAIRYVHDQYGGETAGRLADAFGGLGYTIRELDERDDEQGV